MPTMSKQDAKNRVVEPLNTVFAVYSEFTQRPLFTHDSHQFTVIFGYWPNFRVINSHSIHFKLILWIACV
jgi:hypothetical protein